MKISIRQYIFQVRDPYTEGTIITKAEAQALNALRAENIRNNVSKLVADATGKADGTTRLLAEEDLQELQGKITEYDLKYSFPLRAEKKDPVGMIEMEVEALAKEAVEANIRQNGQPADRFAYDRLVQQALSDPGIQAEARRRVGARQEQARKALEELL